MKTSTLHHVFVAYLLVMGFNYVATIAGKSFIAYENELIENFQAFMLFISMMVFAISLFRCDQSLQVITFCGFLFFLTFLLREVDVESYKIPGIFIQLGSGHGRNIILLSLWFIALAFFFERAGQNMLMLRRLFHSRSGKWYVIGILMLLLGEVLDVIGSHGIPLYEELAEVIGYYFLLIGAISTPGTLQTINDHKSQQNTLVSS